MPKGLFERLSEENADYFHEGKLVGVFVMGLGQDHSHHAGFLFAYEERDAETNQVKVHETRRLDFVDNHKVMFETFKPGKQWLHATMDLEPHDAIALSGYLSGIAQTNDKDPPILYGMVWRGVQGCFDSKGKYTKPDSIDGLTCATFMSEVIGHMFGETVDFQNWPLPDAKDLEWKAEKLTKLRAKIGRPNALSAEQIDEMENIPKWRRLRPAHMAVGAAAGRSKWPMRHIDADQLATQVIADFKKEFAA